MYITQNFVLYNGADSTSYQPSTKKIVLYDSISKTAICTPYWGFSIQDSDSILRISDWNSGTEDELFKKRINLNESVYSSFESGFYLKKWSDCRSDCLLCPFHYEMFGSKVCEQFVYLSETVGFQGKCWQATNGDTIYSEEFRKGSRTDTIIMRSTKSITHSVIFERKKNGTVKQIDIVRSHVNSIWPTVYRWKIRYRKHILKLTHWEGVGNEMFKMCRFEVKVPETLSFTDVLMNKHGLLWAETVPFLYNFDFWMATNLELDI